MIKVFSFSKSIYLISNQNLYIPKENTILASIRSEDEMHLLYDELVKKNHLTEIYFYNEDFDQLYEYFISMFRIINAAGGLVKNEREEWLFIFRNGKWDLPKGKIEKGEAIKVAAIREVEEECGISKLSIIRELQSTYHTYHMEERAILKRTYWFEMSCSDSSKLVPQLEEGITDVKWLSKKQLEMVLANTYESVKEVMKEIG